MKSLMFPLIQAPEENISLQSSQFYTSYNSIEGTGGVNKKKKNVHKHLENLNLY